MEEDTPLYVAIRPSAATVDFRADDWLHVGGGMAILVRSERKVSDAVLRPEVIEPNLQLCAIQETLL